MKKVALALIALSLVFAGCSSGGGENNDPDPDVQVQPDGGGDDQDVQVDPDADTPPVDVAEDVPPVACSDDNPCNDDDPCTDDACVDGECQFTAKQCTPDGAPDCETWACQAGECVKTESCPHPCVDDAAMCNDENACTTDTCHPTEGCQYALAEGPCDDKDPCTLDEACAEVEGAFVCTGGTPNLCDDEDDCTIDWCDSSVAEGCQHQEIGEEDCIEALACPNGVEDCPTFPNPCKVFVCNAENMCVTENTVAACDDSNPCTIDDVCVDGACTAGRLDPCDDGDNCTRDTCQPDQGCVNTPIEPCEFPCPNGVSDCPEATSQCVGWRCNDDQQCEQYDLDASCTDGDPCTDNDYCDAGECVAGLPTDCNDGDPCTECACDPAMGGCDCKPFYFCDATANCVSGSDGADNDPCTIDSCLDYYTPGVCIGQLVEFCSCNPGSADGGALACNDLDPCTIDTCVPNQDPSIPQPGLCEHVPDIQNPDCCEEQCTGDDDRDDGDICTLDTCADLDAGGQCCSHQTIPWPCGKSCDSDADCDDGNPCTEASCVEGRCGPTTVDTCECTPETAAEACADIADDNPCTTVACVDYACVNQPNNDPCDDGDSCTVNDVCQMSGDDVICAGETRDCNDGNECTIDTCVAGEGCRHDLDSENPECSGCLSDDECVDANPCTEDTCEAGLCIHTDLNDGAESPLCLPLPCGDDAQCDDGNPCTTDVCVNMEDGLPLPADLVACVYTPIGNCDISTEAPALACDDSSACDPSTCVADHDDAWCNDPIQGCPTAYCDGAVGCRFVPTLNCSFATCTVETQHNDCWDQNVCTLDLCNPVTLKCDNTQLAYPEGNPYNGCIPCDAQTPCADIPEVTDDPCVTTECRTPDAVSSNQEDPSAGVCVAYVDEELYPERCEDYDLCTLDVCVPGGGCDHELRIESCQPCASDGDCDDLNACTEDACDPSGFICTHTPVDGCLACDTHADCPLTSACDQAFCRGGVCVGGGIGPDTGVVCLEFGCTTGADCDDGDPQTLDLCGDGACVYVPVVPCNTPADCIPTDPCDRPTGCDAGQCVFETIPGCVPQPCESFLDCDDNNGCTVEYCLGGLCRYIPENCCESLADCEVPGADDLDGCTVPHCNVDAQCEGVAFGRGTVRCGNVCENDSDCAPSVEEIPCPADNPDCDPTERRTSFCHGDECYDWPCAEARCNAYGSCVWFDGDCTMCMADSDCVDADPCTVDTCNEGVCEHTPDPGCAATTCNAQNPCDSGDPCVLGICLPSAGCIWVPNPYCAVQ